MRVGVKLQFFCNAMPWVDCTACRYHCTKYPDIDLCPAAFAAGRFPPGTCAKDFIKVDSSSAKPSASGWSEQEELLLLEGLEMHGEAWSRVAEHVGTKNRLDCLLHFLEFSINEDCVAALQKSTGSPVRNCLSGVFCNAHNI